MDNLYFQEKKIELISDDRPTEEERKSVRFDLEKDSNDMYVYSGSEDDDWDTDSEEKEITSDRGETKGSYFETLQHNPLQLPSINKNIEQDNQKDNCPINVPSTSTIIGRRFVVKSVSESEHLCQLTKDNLNDTDYWPNNKFTNIKNIDLYVKSDTESTPRENSGTSNLDEIRKNKEAMLEAMSLTDQRNKRDKLIEKEKSDNLLKLRHDLEIVDHERSSRKSRQECNEENKISIDKQCDKEVELLKQKLDSKLEIKKNEIQDKYRDEKLLLENELEKKLVELKNQFIKKEKDEIEKLISTMDDARTDNLKKAKIELEVCFEKERQEILEKLKFELDERKKELLKLRNHEMEILENEFGKNLDDEISFKTAEHKMLLKHNAQIEELKKELEKDFDDLKNKLRSDQREKVTQITEEHEKCLADILRDFRTEVSQ